VRSRVVSGVAANPKGRVVEDRKEEEEEEASAEEEEVAAAAASVEVRTGMGEMRW
jgi:hypothetical protein